jgi:hypothetical protein
MTFPPLRCPDRTEPVAVPRSLNYAVARCEYSECLGYSEVPAELPCAAELWCAAAVRCVVEAAPESRAA